MRRCTSGTASANKALASIWFRAGAGAHSTRHTSSDANATPADTTDTAPPPPPPGSGPERKVGKVTAWHSFERRGVIVEEETGREFAIGNARAFETVLPTLLRSLDGATVTFTPAATADVDRVIIRSRTEQIHSRSYERKPPVDYYNPFVRNATDRALSGGNGSDEDAPDAPRFATDIIVDLASVPSDKLVRFSGPLVGEDAVKPTTNLKDMRSSRIFDSATNEYLQLTRSLGSAAEAEKEMQRRAAEAQRTAVRREVIATGVSGVVVAWSAIHRSGVVLEGSPDIGPDALVDTTRLNNACIIRNVFSFQSALPTSHNLLHRRVTFTKVEYSTQGDKAFAEEVVVEGGLAYDASAVSIEEARLRNAEEKLSEKRSRARGPGGRIADEEQAKRIMTGEDSGDGTGGGVEAPPPVPEGPVYGVITRWSGGQGTVESGDARRYYIESAADFAQLVEKDSHTVRGAVVTFTVDPERPRYARDVNIMSTATSSVSEMKPLLDRVPGSNSRRRRQADAAAAAKGSLPRIQHALIVEKNALTGRRVPRSVEMEPEGAEWTAGLLLSWSPQEDQGIISGDDGERYVLRDAEDNVLMYATRKPLLKKGRRVKFTAFGSTGRLACNVVALDTEADEAELEEAELRPKEPRFSMDGNMDEAIASPMSTNYWMARMTKVGFDVSDVKKMQDRAITMDEFDDDDDDVSDIGDPGRKNTKKLMDSDELLKADEWWRDPKKNKRFPNSEMTAGHLSLMGPASMLNTALKASNPKTLNKMVNKYQSKLTEQQKEIAWQKAKEMAPKYEEQIRKARETNEEPTFYFF